MFASLVLAAPLGVGLAPVDLRPFPLDPAGVDSTTALPKFVTREGELSTLRGLDQMRLGGAPLPFGGVDLALERVDLDAMQFGFYVDGVARPKLLSELQISLWKGQVEGDPGSEVMLSFSTRGVRGWVETGGEFFHFMPQPGAEGWSRTETWVASESEVRALGVQDLRGCALDLLPNGGRPVQSSSQPPVSSGSVGGGSGSGLLPIGGSCSGNQASLSIETDYQLYQLYNDLAAEAAYVTTLLGAVNGRYQEQIDTTLVFPYVQFYTTPADPWSTPDNGGGSITMLNEFSSAWTGNIPFNSEVGMMLSGAGLGGGVAYVGVLCEDSNSAFTFAVCGNIDGLLPFPVQSGPTTWDFIVTAHELGHNFNSPHTHDYSPQIDNCANGGCISNGTVMSYCHLCPGGLNNMTTFFHPTVIGVMQSHAQACLPSTLPLLAAGQPTLLAPDTVTPLTVEVLGTPTAGVDLNYRFDGVSAFQTIPMAFQSGNTWSAALPGASCGSQVEYFFSTTDVNCGPFQTDTYAPALGVLTGLFADDFEVDTGWTVGAPGDAATTGVWERVDPVGTAAQPENDNTSGGSLCYVTGQGSPFGGLGDNDVDGGATTLISPPVDLSGGDAIISYYRWYSNDTGGASNADVFEVEVSNGGPWVNVETVGPTGAGTSGGWIYHDFTVSDFVSPSANVQVRFRAADEGAGSLIEAGVDDFSVDRLSCDVCQADLGFGGPGTATMTVCGQPLSPGNTSNLSIVGAPAGTIGWVVVGASNASTPLFGGTLVPSADLLLTVVMDGAGSAGLTVNGGASSPVSVFAQTAYVDGLVLGFTNAVELVFLP
ncbi:M12 family metallo-peptidase [Engelhardtia mirabilis]|uniref:MAM domain-containing protein n=1 Tax=Engelhardtia mirabilis TaxID=2528011 RepID=A0A518BRG7_9BACT|nr:hypothetical protein Pla133_46600 [Planctomycetes bacterium Pla133]QDV03866.1 hypothetical protein Pla86_46580 [Planctomycetes bacterium Pla86]